MWTGKLKISSLEKKKNQEHSSQPELVVMTTEATLSMLMRTVTREKPRPPARSPAHSQKAPPTHQSGQDRSDSADPAKIVNNPLNEQKSFEEKGPCANFWQRAWLVERSVGLKCWSFWFGRHKTSWQSVLQQEVTVPAVPQGTPRAGVSTSRPSKWYFAAPLKSKIGFTSHMHLCVSISTRVDGRSSGSWQRHELAAWVLKKCPVLTYIIS